MAQAREKLQTRAEFTKRNGYFTPLFCVNNFYSLFQKGNSEENGHLSRAPSRSRKLLRSDPWGSLQRSPRPLAEFRVGSAKGEGRGEGEGTERGRRKGQDPTMFEVR